SSGPRRGGRSRSAATAGLTVSPPNGSKPATRALISTFLPAPPCGTAIIQQKETGVEGCAIRLAERRGGAHAGRHCQCDKLARTVPVQQQQDVAGGRGVLQRGGRL